VSLLKCKVCNRETTSIDKICLECESLIYQNNKTSEAVKKFLTLNESEKFQVSFGIFSSEKFSDEEIKDTELVVELIRLGQRFIGLRK
jgi:hypothetical protein